MARNKGAASIARGAGNSGSDRKLPLWRGFAFAFCLMASLAGMAAPAMAQDRDARLLHDVNDYQRTVFEGALLGGLQTCAIGALTGFIAGGGRGALTGCIAGGVLGTATGAANGVSVANQKQAYARHEDRLDNQIAVLRKQNNELKSIVLTAGQIVEQRRADLANLKASAVTDPGARDALKSVLTSEIQLLDTAIAKARDDRQKMQNAVAQWRNSDGTDAVASAAKSNAKSASQLGADRRQLDAMRSGL